MAATSWSAIAVAAEPAPRITIRWSRSGVARDADRPPGAPASVTAAVPWMSSLKVQSRSR